MPCNPVTVVGAGAAGALGGCLAQGNARGPVLHRGFEGQLLVLTSAAFAVVRVVIALVIALVTRFF